jgi:hypothetical protein
VAPGNCQTVVRRAERALSAAGHSSDLVVGAGDSGGPAFAGRELVGIVHGEVCWRQVEPPRHVFIHLPALWLFFEAYLP